MIASYEISRYAYSARHKAGQLQATQVDHIVALVNGGTDHDDTTGDAIAPQSDSAGGTKDGRRLAGRHLKVDAAIRRVGTYSDVVFDDPIIHRVISDMGGWIAFGVIDDKEWPFTGNQFKTRYQGYRIRGEVPEYQPVLTGIANAHNSKEGHKTQPPMLIGDESKAKQVMLAGTNEQLIQMRLAGDSITNAAIKQIAAA